jgi:hypothetical protein
MPRAHLRRAAGSAAGQEADGEQPVRIASAWKRMGVQRVSGVCFFASVSFWLEHRVGVAHGLPRGVKVLPPAVKVSIDVVPLIEVAPLAAIARSRDSLLRNDSHVLARIGSLHRRRQSSLDRVQH